MRHLSGLARPISQGHYGITFFWRFRVDALERKMYRFARLAMLVGVSSHIKWGGKKRNDAKIRPMIKDLGFHVFR